MSLPPPSYESFDVVTPDYSFEPRAGEERLEYHRARQLPVQGEDVRPTGVFVNQKDEVTVILNYQEAKSTTPVFGRRSNVEGTLLIDAPESVSKITIKLTGTIETVSPSTGLTSVNVLDQTHTLFNSGDNMAPQSDCSSSLTFSYPLPSTFKHNDQEYLLPPSYYVLLGGQGQTYYAKCTYTFSAMISKTRSRRTAFLGKNKKYNTFVFEFLPRLRPPRPVLKRSLLSTIKECPEEWRQVSYQLIPRPKKSNLEPLTCQFFFPSVGVFGIRDSIPFHVQIIGSHIDSLAKLQTVTDNNKRELKKVYENSGPLFRVHFLRQVEINNNGNNSAVHFPLGEAKLLPVPPLEGAISLSAQQERRQENINWEGVIRCELEEKLAPSFNAGIVVIADFIILELSKSSTSLFQPFKHGHAVRLVSDSWR
ncbi:hypothetical protein F5050DRAFT_1714418 [Lentinula boryana]|uniref:Arrestin-like N-terminal domain-containing protein n=1 Tax=Lentinula boryana TaxID=40481 RepID=A0ABQ8Q582_9AGAR|nr:hypothetical protein F5050DRAFT_1714418 [Lentinula boryana]